MPLTKNDICNEALALISEDLVADVTNPDEGQAAIWANQLYEQCVLEVLSEHPWRCATGLRECAATTGSPDFGYTYSYQLPEDFVRWISLNKVDPDAVDTPIAEVFGQEIYTDETECKLEYVYRVSEAKFSTWLVECIYNKLAYKLAWSVQKNRTLREEMKIDYERILKKSKFKDSIQGRKPIPSHRADSKWIQARYASTNG